MLLARVRAGDEEAFNLLHVMLEARMRAFVVRLIGPHWQVEDIVQEVFIALYRNLAKLEGVEKLYPFLYRVARNRCYDILRQQKRYETVPLQAQTQVLSSASHTQPEEQADWLLLYSQVQKAIDQLPELQRQALILYAEEGLSYGAVAEAMGSQIGTVKSRLYHAKRTLRRLVGAKVLVAFGLQQS